jgi:acetoin utilization deacetylase AcuC-like enzyme/GNAT superfamily N-acetyltransferase
VGIVRIDRISSTATPEHGRRLAAACDILRTAFPAYSDRIAALPGLLSAVHERDFSLIILTLEDARLRPRAVALVHYHADLAYGWLDILATADSARGGGYGGALYQAVGEHLRELGARGLFMDVPSDDPTKLTDPAILPENRARLRFYEAFGARPIIGTDYDGPPPLGQDYDPPYLVFDGLGLDEPLPLEDARAMVRAILIRRYDWEADHPYVARIAESFVDDPVKLRPNRYQRKAPISASLTPFTVVAGEGHRIHHVRERGYVERPARVDAVLAGLAGLPVRRVAPDHVEDSVITRVHDADYATYLETICTSLPERETVYPYVFPVRRPDRKPHALWLRAGYYCIDTFTPLSRQAFAAAREAVDVAATGAARVLAGERLVYALCRPPGHHAERALFGGFCYFNNSAIAARILADRGKVAMLDIDYHHGNGAQSIFWDEPDVLTVSIHGHPNEAYPYFSGFDDETGEGAGAGFNLNLPLSGAVNDDAYLATLGVALERLRAHAPWVIVLGLGFDIMKGDPTGDFQISPEGMGRIGEAVASLGVPVLVVQEGGYTLPNLRRGARALFAALATRRESVAP